MKVIKTEDGGCSSEERKLSSPSISLYPTAVCCIIANHEEMNSVTNKSGCD